MTNLAVEHIQPKDGPYGHPHLIGRWANFLLACVNCNSAKQAKNVVLADVFLPDRDNTFVAFSYLPDGTVQPVATLAAVLIGKARDTLALTGLDKKISVTLDEHGRQVALDRVSQRMEAWAVAEEARSDVDANPGNVAVKCSVIRAAKAYGFFSIWMTVFSNDADMCNRLIDAFAGTRESGCFDPVTARPVSPAPNPDGLADGAKV